MNRCNADLVESFKLGDRTAFDRLMRAHFERAWAIAIAITTDPDDAEDVCSKAFVRCWEKRAQCREPERFSSWLATVVRSVAYNHLRAEKSWSTIEIDRIPLPDPSTADHNARRSEIGAALLDGMKTLSETQREVLVLSDLNGLKHREIAETLGLSEVLSRRHLSDARKRMRAYLKGRGFDDI